MIRRFVLFLAAAALAGPAFAQPAPAQPSPAAPAAPAQQEGEPLPPGVPTDPYELTAWCYGALGEYLVVYRQVIPDLLDIDRTFGSSVQNETEPYAADVADARLALRRFAAAMEAAERASPRPIGPTGAQAISRGRAIWSVAEHGTRRSLARAWLYWGIPDRCDVVARGLYERSTLMAPALAYNARGAASAPTAHPSAVTLAPIVSPVRSDEPIPGAVSGPPLPAIAAARPAPAAPAMVASASPQPPPAASPAARPSRVIDDGSPVATAPAEMLGPAVPAPLASPPPSPTPQALPPAALPPPAPPPSSAEPPAMSTASAEPEPPPPAAVEPAPAPPAPTATAAAPLQPIPVSDESQEPML